MRILLLCATRRGYLFLEKLAELLPRSELIVFSFREELREPPFVDDICDLTLAVGGQFVEIQRTDVSLRSHFQKYAPIDLMLVVSWRYLIPSGIYGLPRKGTFVFHDSLLPEYRGFSPTVWAIVNGEDHTGVSIFEIAEEVDSGPIVDQEHVPIGPDENIATVMERVTQTYLALLERNLLGLMNGTAPRRAQDHSRATYTCKRLPEDNLIDWRGSSRSIYNLIRGVSSPYRGAYTYLRGQELRVWSAHRPRNPRTYVGGIPGRVTEVRTGEGTVVLTGDGSLLLKQVQVEPGKIVPAADFLSRGGQTLGSYSERHKSPR